METSETIQSPLFNTIQAFLKKANKDQKIFLYVPYIKTKILSELITGIESKIIIITALTPANILSGASELELYTFCKSNNITLYTNKDIHLKVYSINFDNTIISSGNISEHGMMSGKNYEIGVFLKKLEIKDKLYLERIRNKSILINDDMYLQLQKWYNRQDKNTPKTVNLDDILTIPQKDNFLISVLPMTKSIDKLIDGYIKITTNQEPASDLETRACIYHDLVNYDIPLGLSKDDFIISLKNGFFKHPFVQRIEEFIHPEAYFGSIKEWVQKNCTDVPIPSRRELTGNVQVLYQWFEKLSDGKYIIDTPQHSQRLKKCY